MHSTRSVAVDENEQVVRYVLDKRPNVETRVYGVAVWGRRVHKVGWGGGVSSGHLGGGEVLSACT